LCPIESLFLEIPVRINMWICWLLLLWSFISRTLSSSSDEEQETNYGDFRRVVGKRQGVSPMEIGNFVNFGTTPLDNEVLEKVERYQRMNLQPTFNICLPKVVGRRNELLKWKPICWKMLSLVHHNNF